MSRASDAATLAELMNALYVVDLRPRLFSVQPPAPNHAACIAYEAYRQTRGGMEHFLEGQYVALRTGTTHVNETADHFIMFEDLQWLINEMRTALASYP